MHEHCIEERVPANMLPDIVDVVSLCSDACHREWCQAHDEPYGGWNGCHELEHTGWCANCGVVLPGTDDACEHQLANVVVNRFESVEGERCEHGNWIQVPASYLEVATC